MVNPDGIPAAKPKVGEQRLPWESVVFDFINLNEVVACGVRMGRTHVVFGAVWNGLIPK